MYEGNQVREFYSQLPRPVLVGIEATGSMQRFLNLVDELGINHSAAIRAGEPRKAETWQVGTGTQMSCPSERTPRSGERI